MNSLRARRRPREPHRKFAPALLRTSAATVGTLPLAWTFSWALAAVLPIGMEARAAILMLLSVPLWIALRCFAFLSKSGLRVWAICLAGSAVLWIGAMVLSPP